MNKKIFELSEQAGMNHYSYNGYATFDLEKFAELIVRECAKVVSRKAGPKTALDVLEHFGVEE